MVERGSFDTPSTLALSRASSRTIATLGVLWLVAVVSGMAVVLAYASASGAPATAPPRFPAETAVPRPAARALLVLFLHPRCPCSRATVSELAVLMARERASLDAVVLVLRPAGVDPGWERTDLWTAAERIPGVRVLVDEEGREARRFGARTSGQVLVYDANGTLVFSGGITAARGHEGDNAGRDDIQSLVETGRASGSHTQVYGCRLDGPAGGEAGER